MAHPAVQLYLTILGAYLQPINTAIVDPVTEDFVAGLTGEALARAVFEVDVLGQATTLNGILRGKTLVARANLLADNAAAASASAATAQAAAGSAATAAGTALTAATSAQTAATSAQSAANAATTAAATATTTASAAQTSASSAISAANTATTLANAAQTTANQALTLAGSGSNMPRAVLRATGLAAVTVGTGTGQPTLIPFPAGALRGTPLTQPAGDFTLSAGVVRITQPGVYSYDISAVFTTALLTVGPVRLQVAVGDNLATPGSRVVDADESATHHVLNAVLGATTGLSGGGTFQIPVGGRDIGLLAGHSAVLGTAVTVSEIRMSLRRIGNL
jgi:hypothetical protein